MADTPKQVMKNLNREIKDIADRTMGGLLAGGLVIERESNLHVPREYGNLVGSSYTRKAQDGELAVEIGYTAAYAVFVHENLAQKLKGQPRASGLGVYWGPAGQPRFLANAVRNTQDEVVKVIAKYSRVKS